MTEQDPPSNSEQQPAADALNDSLSPELAVQADFEAGLGLLKYIHARERVIEFGSLETGLPPIEIKPFYMNRTDPDNLGVWQLSFDGQDPVRLSSFPDQKISGEQFQAARRVTDESGARIWVALSTSELEPYGKILRAAGEHFDSQQQAQVERDKKSLWSKLFRRFTS